MPENKSETVAIRILLNKEQADGQFVALFNRLADQINQCSIDHGFWENDPSVGEKIALAHSELSEALEAYRRNNPPDDKVPEFTQAEVELADCIIRILDFGRQKRLRLAEAIIAKHQYNQAREYKHGKTF